jgi:hypothetical protein
MRSLAIKLLQLNANIYSFLSGIFLSMSINLYASIFSQDVLPSRWIVLALSSACTLISSLFWSAIAWQLDGIQKLALVDSPNWVNAEALLVQIASTKKFRLIICYLISILAAGLGLGILLVGLHFSTPASPIHPLPTPSPLPTPR